MSLILTWGDFLAALKREGNLNTTADDTMLLELANEILIEEIAVTENLRDFRVDSTQAISLASGHTFPTYYWREIEQIWYIRDLGFTGPTWDLTENTGRVCPAPVDNRPDSYTVVQGSVGVVPDLRITFHPVNSGVVGDHIRIVGTAFQEIASEFTLMPYLNFYPMLKRSILQRLQIQRGIKPDVVGVWDGLVERGMKALPVLSDRGNSFNNDTKTP